jgi:hypothetical protein
MLDHFKQLEDKGKFFKDTEFEPFILSEHHIN